MTALISYSSYAFRNKDPVIDVMRTIAQDEDLTPTKIHEFGGPTPGTTRNWFFGKTRRPNFSTIAAFAGAAGYEVGFIKKRAAGNGVVHDANPRILRPRRRNGRR